MSQHPLRPGYPLPPNGGKLGTRPVTYSSQTFSSQLHHHYNFNPPPNQAGFSFQNSMLLPSPLPITSTNMPLPESPVQESSDVILPMSRRHSASSHGSPIPPNSPIMEESSTVEQYKICNYRAAATSSSINSFGMNTPFNSFPSHHQSTALCGMGYPNHSSAMCPASVYTTPDNMCHNAGPTALGTPPLGLPMWNYPTMSLQGSSITKLSLDSPRYKLTPERAIPLIKWFEDHKEHPYPTRHEKMLLCQSTQLTYTQVSTWFANARRRMKKANSEEEENRSNHSSSDEQNSLESSPQRS